MSGEPVAYLDKKSVYKIVCDFVSPCRSRKDQQVACCLRLAGDLQRSIFQIVCLLRRGIGIVSASITVNGCHPHLPQAGQRV